MRFSFRLPSSQIIQGVYALQKAWERSSKFARQNDRLTEIAKEARHLADEHYLDAGEVFKIATKSLNTSQTAFRSVVVVVDRPRETEKTCCSSQ